MGKYTLKRKGQMNDKDSHRQMIGAEVGCEKFDRRSWWVVGGLMGITRSNGHPFYSAPSEHH